MTTYLSPGIYVKEVSSGAVSIAGVGTSTAGFIGIVVATANSSAKAPKKGNEKGANTPPTAVSHYQLQKVIGEVVGKGDGIKEEFALSRYPVDDKDVVVKVDVAVKVEADKVEADKVEADKVEADKVDVAVKVEADKVGADNQPTVIVNNDLQKQISTITLSPPPEANAQISVDYYPQSLAEEGEVQLCTNFTEFKKFFGDFSSLEGQSNLAHAVYGFFRNGGTRCFVTWVAKPSGIVSALEDFAAIDEIAIVAAPGSTDKAVLGQLSDHCQELGDRVAILDAPQNVPDLTKLTPGGDTLPGRSDYAAFYYPWIQVLDPATNKNKYVPPSGHIAGIYARVDAQRGVHKAPANEAILGAIGLQTALTRAKQDGLNPQGVNCIRNLNGNITVWGARTWGGDANGEFKYINIRRLFNYLRESIDEGTQWVVFEPNSPELWARVRRSVTAFLTMVWRSGALFGATPQEAFFVQCDAETNPPEVRDAGQLIVKIGVAVVKPAEFVIFELSQWSGGK